MDTCYVDKESRTIADLTSAKNLGICEDSSALLITRINVPIAHRGQGKGTVILDRILTDADREGVTLYVQPSSSGDWSHRMLRAWYERHGFVNVRSGFMVRVARKV